MVETNRKIHILDYFSWFDATFDMHDLASGVSAYSVSGGDMRKVWLLWNRYIVQIF